MSSANPSTDRLRGTWDGVANGLHRSWGLVSDPWRAKLEIIILVLLVVLLLPLYPAWPRVQERWQGTDSAATLPLSIAVSDLGSDPGQVRREDYVTLVVLIADENDPAPEFISYPNLQVRDVIFKDAKPETIVLSVSENERDAILLALKDKQKLYLQSQGKATLTPTPTPTTDPAAAPTTDANADTSTTECTTATPTPYSFLLPIKVSDLSNDSHQLQREIQNSPLVTLIFVAGGKGDDPPKSTPYTNLGVSDVLDANGRDVTVTHRKPHTIVLSVSEKERDAILSALHDSKTTAKYLQFQGLGRIEPTPTAEETPTPTATTPAGSVAFNLPAPKIRSDLYAVKRGDTVVVIAVVERKDLEGRVVEHKAFRCNEATLLDVLDAKGAPLLPPDADATSIAEFYKDAASVRISLPLDPASTCEPDVASFAAHVEDLSVFYLVPATPTPAPSLSEEK